MKPLLLDAEWRTGDACSWLFQKPTRVSGFEVEEPSGELLSIVVAGEEQLMLAAPEGRQSIAVIELVEWWPNGVPESREPGWKIGRIHFPSFNAGGVLQMVFRGFRGRVRPFGVQVP